MTKVCRDCRRDLPVSDFYAKTRNEDGTPRTYGSYCKSCCLDRQRARGGHKPRTKRQEAVTRRVRRAKRQRRYREIMADPERREALRARKREQARRRRERAKSDAVLAAKLEASRQKYQQRVQNDPERHAMKLIDQRIRWRKTHPEHGHRSPPGVTEEWRRTHDLVPAEPFKLWLLTAVPGATPETLQEQTGVDAKRFREVFEGQATVTLGLVDTALTRGFGRPDVVSALYPLEV